MIKNNQKSLNGLHVALDMCVTAVSYVASWYFVIGSGIFHSPVQVLPMPFYMGALAIIEPVYLALYLAFSLFVPKRAQSARKEFLNIIKANLVGLGIFSLVLFLGGKNPYLYNFSRKLVVVFCAVNVFLETAERCAIRLALRYIRSRGYNQKHIVLVGYSRTAEQYINRVQANPQWGYRIRGILDDDIPWGTQYRGVTVFGKVKDLAEILKLNQLDEIAITLKLEKYACLPQIVHECEKSGVHTKFIPDYNRLIPTRPYTEDLSGLPVINIRRVPLNDPVNAFVKRMMDVAGALAAIIIFSPVMLITALAIRISSKGPVIYCQTRVGLHNREFKMYKFRSMTVQEEEEEAGKWTRPGDPRVTFVGRFIRSTSIDELPQLFNVLRGDMSLSGPRPERPQFVERFREEIPRYMVKHQVRPGMTGWAQVNGLRGDTSIEQRIEHDLYYIENWTIGLDIKILFLTVFKGFVNKNAY